jgi:gliding motility-associated-like protein
LKTYNQLKLLSEPYNLKIYNRWGELLFETNDITNGWNGKNKEGNSVPAGVYFWIASFGATASNVKCDGTSNGTQSKLTKGFLQLER